MVHFRRCLVTAVQDHPAIQILVLLRGEPHEAKLLGHAVLGNHRAGNGCRLFDIICGTGRHRIKYDLFRGAAAQGNNEPGFQLFLCVQELLFFRNLQHIAQCAHSPRYDRDLLHRFRVLLKRGKQRVAHLVVGHDPPLLRSEYTVFLFLADQHQFHRVKQVLLAYRCAAPLDRQDRRLIDHIGQVGAHSPAGGQSDRVEVNRVIHKDVLGMDPQDCHPAFQIRAVHDDAPVKAARSQEGRVQHFGAVGRRNDQEALG